MHGIRYEPFDFAYPFTSFIYIVARKFLLDECEILFFGIKKDSVKSISAFFAVFRLCNAHKLYSMLFSNLLPYMALANRRASLFRSLLIF